MPTKEERSTSIYRERSRAALILVLRWERYVSAGGADMFVLKLDAQDGSTVWGKRIGGTGDDYAADLVTGGGKVYLAGNFSSTVDFDPGQESPIEPRQAIGMPSCASSIPPVAMSRLGPLAAQATIKSSAWLSTARAVCPRLHSRDGRL